MKLLTAVIVGLLLPWLILNHIRSQTIPTPIDTTTPPSATQFAISSALGGALHPLMDFPFVQRAKLVASNREVHGNLGPVAIGDTVVVAASGDDESAALVFVQPSGGWSGVLTETARLIGSDVVTYADFINSLAINGDTIVFGSPGHDNRGSVYVFIRPASDWSGMLTETARLTASDGADLNYFGYSVATGEDIVVVGAPGHDSTRGAAYVFIKPPGGWVTTSTFIAKLTASDGVIGDGFGDKVAIRGDTIVMSAPGDDSKRGSIYVFNKPALGWGTTSTFAAKLTASDSLANDSLGYSLAFSNDTIAAGAVGDDNFTGSAYVFVKPTSGWMTTSTYTAKLTASDRAMDDKFGISIATVSDTVVIGAWSDDIGTNADQGSVYIFVKPGSGWGGSMTETTKLTDLDGEANDAFGISVAASGNIIVAGASGDDNTKGAAYLFTSHFLVYLPVILH